MRPIAIDLFAGAGGMSLGFEQAGFDIAAAVEVDPVHSAVHKFNFPECAVLARSVSEVSADEIRKVAGLGDRVVDCVIGGPPCQGFSLIGHRALDDSRNRLVLDFVRLVKELDARSFVFENVKGLTVGKHRAFLAELVEAFDSAGYVVRLPWRVLDAADFAVPQHRERLILMGAKRTEILPEYPMPTVWPADGEPILGLERGPTCGDALGDLPDADSFATLDSSDSVKTTRFGAPSKYAADLRCLSNDAWRLGHMRRWNPAILTSSARTEHTDISRRRFAETAAGAVEPISRFFKLAPDGLSNTLRAGTDGARGAFTSPRPIHYLYPRCVTVREMGRLHGYPDWFRFHVTKWHGAREVGNSVPPPLARAVGTAVAKALGCKVSRSRRQLDLGVAELLSLDMSAAALHFEVPSLVSRRDRKSGARKRKQSEIERARLDAKSLVHV